MVLFFFFFFSFSFLAQKTVSIITAFPCKLIMAKVVKDKDKFPKKIVLDFDENDT